MLSTRANFPFTFKVMAHGKNNILLIRRWWIGESIYFVLFLYKWATVNDGIVNFKVNYSCTCLYEHEYIMYLFSLKGSDLILKKVKLVNLVTIFDLNLPT